MLSRWRFTLFAALVATASVAQDINDVHVQPPASEKRHTNAADTLETHTKPFVSNVDVVLVPVTVTDEATRIVTGLEPPHFILLEDGKPQTINYFYTQDAPISVGIIFDESGSMRSAMGISRDAVAEFMKASNPEDEFFLIAFADKPRLVSDFTNRPEDIDATLLSESSRGRTALWDAVYLGLNKMTQAKNAKRVLMVFSDGGENHSRYTEKELLRFVREADVQVFGISIPGADYGPGSMEGVSNATGGRLFLGPPTTFADTAEKIAVELRNQYVLGYVSANHARDGRLCKIRVKLQRPPGLPPLVVTAKKAGYYAPKV
jgi:Ca-activated chloride channel family protein